MKIFYAVNFVFCIFVACSGCVHDIDFEEELVVVEEEGPEFDDIHFSSGSARLSTNARKQLEQYAKELREDLDLDLVIQGHTDKWGSSKGNLELGEKRAKAVADYLSSRGIAKERISLVSFGEYFPKSLNTDKKAFSENRRVQIDSSKIVLAILGKRYYKEAISAEELWDDEE